MKRTICDLCGKVIIGNEYKLILPMQSVTHATDIRGVRYVTYKLVEPKEIDVCDHCFEQLFEFTKNLRSMHGIKEDEHVIKEEERCDGKEN